MTSVRSDEIDIDFAVIGSGPAGSIVACLLARAGARVALIDRERDKSFKIGETLPGETRPMLKTYQLDGVIDQVDKLKSSGNRSFWGSARPIERSSILNPYGGGWHVDRLAFDAALLREALKAGAELIAPVFVEKFERTECGWRIRLKSGETMRCLRAGTTIDASGRNRFFVRKQAVPQIKHDALVGCYRVFQTNSVMDTDLFTTIESDPSGWWYSSCIPGQRRVVVYFTDFDLLRENSWSGNLWGESLKITAMIKGLIGDYGYQCVGHARSVLADTSRLATPRGEGWWAVGDAAATLDPLSSSGMMIAVRSAVEVVRQILDGSGGTKSDSWGVDHDKQNELRMKYYGQERRWISSSFWSRRQAPRDRTLSRAVHVAPL